MRIYSQHWRGFDASAAQQQAVVLDVLNQHKDVRSWEVGVKREASNGTILLPNGEVFQPGGWNWGHWGMALSTDAALHVEEGANIVRIILRWWGLYSDPKTDSYTDGAPGHINQTNLALLDQNIQWCADANLWINLAFDSNCGQNGAQDNLTMLYCTVGGNPAQNFWSNLGMRTKFKEAWTFLVQRYKNVNRIAWYEILPEPSPPNPYTDAEVSAFYADMIPVLRAVDPVTPILIGPNNAYFAPKIFSVYNSTYTNVVYTADCLDPVMRTPSNLAGKIAWLTNFRNQTGSPVFIQQAGLTITSDSNGTLLDSGLQAMIDNNVGFTGWEYRGPSYPEYSVWWKNNTVWEIKTIPYNVWKSKFGIWSTPVNSSTPTTTTTTGQPPSSSNQLQPSIAAFFFRYFM